MECKSYSCVFALLDNVLCGKYSSPQMMWCNQASYSAQSALSRFDTKTALSVSDITSVSPATLLPFALNSLLLHCLCPPPPLNIHVLGKHHVLLIWNVFVVSISPGLPEPERRINSAWGEEKSTSEECGKTTKYELVAQSPAFSDLQGRFRSQFFWPPQRGDGGLNHVLRQEWS